MKMEEINLEGFREGEKVTIELVWEAFGKQTVKGYLHFGGRGHDGLPTWCVVHNGGDRWLDTDRIEYNLPIEHGGYKYGWKLTDNIGTFWYTQGSIRTPTLVKYISPKFNFVN